MSKRPHIATEPANDRPPEDVVDTREGQGIVDSSQLLKGARQLLIRHGVEIYRLQKTRNDKLILVK